MILQTFYNENLLVGEELQKALANKDFTAAEQITHKIKGSAGNIGAIGLHDAAAQLQNALKEKNEALVHPALESFGVILRKTLAEIRKEAFIGA